MESISLKCPNCGAVLTVPDTYLGRTSKCGRCRHFVSIVQSGGPILADVRRGRQLTDWYNVLMNVALGAILLLLLGIILRYIF